jgi:hypothetical protein
MHGDEEALGVEAVHLDQSVIVRNGGVDDDENEIEVLVDRLPDVEPEEAPAGEQILSRLPRQVQLPAALLLKDVANRPTAAIGRCGPLRAACPPSSDRTRARARRSRQM